MIIIVCKFTALFIKIKPKINKSYQPAHPFTVRHICKPTRANAPSKGLQKSLPAHPTPMHRDRAVLRLRKKIIFDDKLTKKQIASA